MLVRGIKDLEFIPGRIGYKPVVYPGWDAGLLLDKRINAFTHFGQFRDTNEPKYTFLGCRMKLQHVEEIL